MKILATISLTLFLGFFILFTPVFGLQEINIQFSRPANTPYFVGQPEMNIDAEEFNTVSLKIKANKAGVARLFWASSLDNQMNDPKSVAFYLKKSGDFQTYTFNVRSQNPYWLSYIGQFLVISENGPDSIEIGPATAIQGNLITNLRSAWLEFWGPKGRMVTGSTINLIPSSAIFGRSINIYVYWAIGIFFIGIFAYYFFSATLKQKDHLSLCFLKATRNTFVFLVLLWGLLSLNTDFNYFSIGKTNYTRYFGKTIEAKRELSYGQDYYQFLLFAQNKLPKEPVKFALLSARYAAELQARIFLVPHYLISDLKKEFTYVLLFNPAPEQIASIKGFSLFARLNDKAYIMKRNAPCSL
ncbi:MAG: hypothetical protein WCT39_06460 [Candidatus Margulisiibacteriota bacterium]